MEPQTLAQFAVESVVRPLCIYPRGALRSINAYSSGIKGRTFFFVLLIVFVAERYSNVAQCERHT